MPQASKGQKTKRQISRRRGVTARSPSRTKSKGRSVKASTTKGRYWSGEVTRGSNALDLERNVFKSKDPKRIATSLKRSAQASKRRKAEPYRSAMSMLNFYINRAGKALPASQRRVLEQAKDELRKVFGRA